VNLILIDISPV